jgi:hypothetical protein
MRRIAQKRGMALRAAESGANERPAFNMLTGTLAPPPTAASPHRACNVETIPRTCTRSQVFLWSLNYSLTGSRITSRTCPLSDLVGA